MLWLDGSSSLPFPIISAPLLSKYCLEDLAETLAELENQAKIVKSCVEIGNFDHWCIAASELVDLANLVVWKDNSFLYWDGLISESERLRHCSQVSSRLVDSVSFSTFERARERLLAISKPSNPIPITCRNQSVDQRPSSGSTKSGAEVTTLSPALPCHAAAPTTTTTSYTIQPPQQPHQAPNEPTRDTHAPGAREVERGGGEETKQAGGTGEYQPPPLPVTPEHQQGPTPGPCHHPQRTRR